MNRNSFINTFASLLVSISVLVGVAIPMKSLAETQPAAGAAAEVSTISGPQTDLNNVIKNYTSSELNRDLGLLIPILSVMIIFGGPVLIVILLVTQHYKAQKRLMELRRECIGKLIDAGKDVPESLLFFDDLARDKNPERDLSRGIKM